MGHGSRSVAGLWGPRGPRGPRGSLRGESSSPGHSVKLGFRERAGPSWGASPPGGARLIPSVGRVGAKKPGEKPFLGATCAKYGELTAEVFGRACGRQSTPRRCGGAKSAWGAHEQGRGAPLRAGGAVGAFPRAPRRPPAPRGGHAMLLGLTHDNPSPPSAPAGFLTCFPRAALVALACGATGSTPRVSPLFPPFSSFSPGSFSYPNLLIGRGGGRNERVSPPFGYDGSAVFDHRSLDFF
ncbi:unnamed protein product [Arctia plantaginis]|uniref:Uncharacterized protein n=1 Tax=Arctia plantaginis TaxID=874455 RepID=A0A8S0YTZ0_ARCPL|nr:unnamed protein product [Arctia plantaginis]